MNIYTGFEGARRIEWGIAIVIALVLSACMFFFANYQERKLLKYDQEAQACKNDRKGHPYVVDGEVLCDMTVRMSHDSTP